MNCLSFLLLLVVVTQASILSRLTWASIRESIPIDAKSFDQAIHAPKHIIDELARLCAREFTSCQAVQAPKRVADLEACYADEYCREYFWNHNVSWWQTLLWRKEEILSKSGCIASKDIKDCQALMHNASAQHRLQGKR